MVAIRCDDFRINTRPASKANAVIARDPVPPRAMIDHPNERTVPRADRLKEIDANCSAVYGENVFALDLIHPLCRDRVSDFHAA